MSTSSAATAPKRVSFDLTRWADFAAPIGLLLVALIFFIATPRFLTVANITDVLVSASVLAVLAMGQQLVVVVAGIDLSVGASLPWAAGILGYLFTHGSSIALSLIAAVIGGLLVGLLNGLLVAYLGMTDFVVTLGSLSVFSGLTLLLTQGNNVPVISAGMLNLANGGIGPIRWMWLIALLVSLVVWVLLFRTRLGTHLLATGGNADAARSAGVSVKRNKLIAYAGSGLLAGLAAIMFVARNGSANPSLQTSLLLSSIAAVVLGGSSLFGGKASVLGTLAGAILLTMLINGFTLMQISQYYQPVAVGAVVLLAALLATFQK